MNGKCERDPETDCAWQLIYDRLKKLGKLDKLKSIWEIKDWSLAQGPHELVHEET